MAILFKSLKVKSMIVALVGMLACSERPSFFEVENLSAGSVVEALMMRKGKRGRDMNAATGGASDFEKRLRYNVTLLDEIRSLREPSPTSVTSETNGPADVVVVGCEARNPLCRSGEFMRKAIALEEGSVYTNLAPEVISFANGFWKEESYSAAELRQEVDRIEKEAQTKVKSLAAEMIADRSITEKVHAFVRGAAEYIQLARQVVDEEAEEIKLTENIDETVEDVDEIPAFAPRLNKLQNSFLATRDEKAAHEEEIAARRAETDRASKQKTQNTLGQNADFEAEQQEMKQELKARQDAIDLASRKAAQKARDDEAAFKAEQEKYRRELAADMNGDA